jgi:hypothetical protein
MSQSRAVMLAAVLGIFLLIIVFSQEAGHVIDDRQADSLGEASEATTQASRTFGSAGEKAISHGSGTESSGRRLSRPPKPRFTFKPNRENVDTVFNPKEQQQQPLPDFRLPSDKPDEAFARIKDHFEVRSHDGSGHRRRGAAGGGGDDGALRFFPLPMRVTYVRQLHHGIYECRGRIPSSSPSSAPVAEAGGAAAALDPAEQELVFAFKTECRPESKWHGQQGYPEILTNWVVETMFGAQFIGSFTPGAVGGLIRIASSLVDKIHRDGCGFLSEGQIAALYDHRQGADNDRMKRSGDKTTLHPPLESGERVLVGAVLQWMPRHSDDAIPGVSVLVPFRAARTDLRQPNSPIALPHLPLSASTSGRRTPLSLASVLQISDIFSLDYVLGNEDRLDKNWFKDAQQRFIAMDNGWALAGFNYDGSACDLDESNLRCPPLFRKLVAGKQLCGGKAVVGAAAAVTDEEVYNCRFRRSTVQSVRRLIQVLEAAAAADDGRVREKDDLRSLVGLFRRDTLLAFLATFYNTVEMRNTVKNNKGNKKKRPWSNALARYVVGCPHQDSGVAAATAAKSLSVPELAAMVNAGLLMRAKRLVTHVDSCVVQFGDTTVLF